MLSSEGLLVVVSVSLLSQGKAGVEGGDFLVFLWIPHRVSHVYHRWFVFDTETKDLVTVHTDGNEQLSVMRYSPGQTQLSLLTNSALCTRDS